MLTVDATNSFHLRLHKKDILSAKVRMYFVSKQAHKGMSSCYGKYIERCVFILTLCFP